MLDDLPCRYIGIVHLRDVHAQFLVLQLLLGDGQRLSRHIGNDDFRTAPKLSIGKEGACKEAKKQYEEQNEKEGLGAVCLLCCTAMPDIRNMHGRPLFLPMS